MRVVIIAGYLASQLLAEPTSTTSVTVVAGSLFGLYCLMVLIFRNARRVRVSTYPILVIDLCAMVLLVLLGARADVGIALLMFYFLVAQAALLHGPREILALTSISLVFFAAWLAGADRQFRFSISSFMFMLVVGGSLGWYFTYQGQRIEQRISSALRQAGGLSESDMALAVEAALRELSIWLRASRAVLALWDTQSDYYAICQYPPQRGPSDPPPVALDQRPEWACMAGNRMDFHANDVSLTDESGRRVQRDFDLHPYLVQKFEIYNAVGCGLFDGERPIGRLLLINCVGDVRPSQRKKMGDVAHLFRDVVRHLLVVRRTEYESAEIERGRIAHDLHDGPLQSVISFEMRLQIIRKLRERDMDAANLELDALYDLSRRLVGEMRTFVHRMRPIESDDSSLSAAARRLVEGFQKETGVAVTVMGLQNGDFSLPGKIGGEVLKIAREALHNIYKHAQATHVLFAVERKNSELLLSVDDNGQGFRFGGKYTLEELDALSMGPRSIKQRVRTLGGRLTLESNPGHGANLRVTVPLSTQ